MTETTITKIEDLDAKDTAFVAGYIANRNRESQPQVGDFIEFLDRKILRIIDGRGEHLCTNQNWRGDLGEVHVSPHGASFSSYSKGPSVPRDLIKTTDKVLPGVFWFFHHQQPHPGGIRIEIPCRVFQQVEGISRLMCWSVCNSVYTSIHGYQIKQEQRWVAQFERDGEKVLGEFPNGWEAERACKRHYAQTKAPGTGKHMYWSRDPRVHTSRHGYRITQTKRFCIAELVREGQTKSMGEFAKVQDAQEACERHHLGQLGISDQEVNAAFAERRASEQEAAGEYRSKIAKKAAATRARRHQKKIETVALKVSAQGNVGPRPNCACCGKALLDPESIKLGIGPECWQGILQFIERQKSLRERPKLL